MEADRIRQTYERYPDMFTKGDVDGVVALYADDATIEDPIGSDLHEGRDAIRAFYESTMTGAVMKRTGPVRVAGLEAACPFVILIGPEGPDQKALDIISTMVFDDAGRIKQMRAFWSFSAMRPANAE